MFPFYYAPLKICEKLYCLLAKTLSFFFFFFAEIIIFCLNRFRTVTVVFMFAVRGFVTGAFQAAYVYTPEVRR